jgi:hypothetical protein
MGLQANTRDEVHKETVTIIDGQPTDQDVTLLEKELIAIPAMILTTLVGGGHGHTGTFVEPAKYFLMMGGIAIIAPANPGNYPAGPAANAAAGIRTRKEAMHKELVAQFEILTGVEQTSKDMNIEAVESDYLLEIEDETLVFFNQTPRTMLNHLCNRGGALDFADTKTYWLKETKNGTQVRYQCCTSIKLKRQ